MAVHTTHLRKLKWKYLVGIIDNHGGGINKFLGDGLMAIFGTPFSHEDDPERAARASLEIVNEIWIK